MSPTKSFIAWIFYLGSKYITTWILRPESGGNGEIEIENKTKTDEILNLKTKCGQADPLNNVTDQSVENDVGDVIHETDLRVGEKQRNKEDECGQAKPDQKIEAETDLPDQSVEDWEWQSYPLTEPSVENNGCDLSGEKQRNP